LNREVYAFRRETALSFDEEVEKINRKKFDEMMQARLREEAAEGKKEQKGPPMVLTDSTFSTEIGKHPLMVVDFWASWCQPCKLVAPLIEELANEYAGRVTFGKLNVDENPAVSQLMGIQSIPTILVFKDGQPVDAIIGAVPKSQIESRFLRHLRGEHGLSPYR